MLLFTGLLSVWLIWYPKIVDGKVLAGYLSGNASLTGWILRLLGAPVTIDDTMISSSAFSMRIGHECSALVPMVILLFGLVAFPARTLSKLTCLAIGLPVIFVLNLVRTVSLYYIGVYIPDFFEIAHFVIWQSAMVLSVIAVWLIWIRKVQSVRPA
jgi:exosortase/archaeosortase family protein